jgi:transposase InsO family protein
VVKAAKCEGGATHPLDQKVNKADKDNGQAKRQIASTKGGGNADSLDNHGRMHGMSLRPKRIIMGNGDKCETMKCGNKPGSSVSHGKSSCSSFSRHQENEPPAIDSSGREGDLKEQSPARGNKCKAGGNTRRAVVNTAAGRSAGGSKTRQPDDGKSSADSKNRCSVQMPRRGDKLEGKGDLASGNESGSWIRPKSPREWQVAQENDHILGEVIKLKRMFGMVTPPKEILLDLPAHVKKYCMKEWSTLTFVNDVLCRVKHAVLSDQSTSSDQVISDDHLDQQDHDVTVQRLVPRVWRRGVFDMVHASQLGAHLGFDRVYPLACQRFYWVGMAKDFRSLLKDCHSCAVNKPSPARTKLPLCHDIPERCLERLALDVGGPFEESTAGNKYVLVIQDYFTKWMEIYCLPNQKAPTVARCVFNFICHFGCPDRLHSDQGRNFESKLFQELCNLFKIKKTRTCPYTPWSDGMVERSMKTIGSLIQTYTKPGRCDWDQYMDPLAAAYRATKHASTGFTPNKMMFGRELSHPTDLVYGRVADATMDKDAGEHVQQLESKVRAVWTQTRQALKKSADIQQKSKAPYVIDWQFEVGDIVYKILPKGGKISSKWIGPCRVTTVMSRWLLEIEHGNKRYLVNANNLKPFRELKASELAP